MTCGGTLPHAFHLRPSRRPPNEAIVHFSQLVEPFAHLRWAAAAASQVRECGGAGRANDRAPHFVRPLPVLGRARRSTYTRRRQMPGLPPRAAPAACRCRRRSSSYVRKPTCFRTLRRACDIRTATRRRRRGSCCRRPASLQAGAARGQRRGQVCPRAAAVQVGVSGGSV